MVEFDPRLGIAPAPSVPHSQRTVETADQIISLGCHAQNRSSLYVAAVEMATGHPTGNAN